MKPGLRTVEQDGITWVVLRDLAREVRQRCGRYSADCVPSGVVRTLRIADSNLCYVSAVPDYDAAVVAAEHGIELRRLPQRQVRLWERPSTEANVE